MGLNQNVIIYFAFLIKKKQYKKHVQYSHYVFCHSTKNIALHYCFFCSTTHSPNCLIIYSLILTSCFIVCVGILYAGKKDAFLLDINGRPRKSPREHASTLAILSCLVQQRRKREKELNGGVSPEKQRQRRSGVGVADLCDDGSNTVTTTDTENDEFDDEPDEDLAMETDRMADENQANDVDAAAATGEDMQPIATKAVVVKLEADSDAEPMDIPADPPPTPPPDDTATAFKSDISEPAATAAHIYPPMPNLEYKSAHQLCREIDDMFAASEHDARLAGYLDDMDVDDGNRLTATDGETAGSSGSAADRYDDLVLIGTPVDFVDIVQSVPEGPLRYRHQRGGTRKKGVRKSPAAALGSFGFSDAAMATGSSGASATAIRKRRNNRTGWPTLPRRRPTIPVAAATTEISTGTTAVEAATDESVAVVKTELVADCDTEVSADVEDTMETASATGPTGDDEMLLGPDDETTCSTALSVPLTDRDEDIEDNVEEDNIDVETEGTELEDEPDSEKIEPLSGGEEDDDEEVEQGSQELEPTRNVEEHDDEDCEQASQEPEPTVGSDDDVEEEAVEEEDDAEETVKEVDEVDDDGDATATGSVVAMEDEEEIAEASPATTLDNNDEDDVHIDETHTHLDMDVAEAADAIQRARSLCAAFAASGSEKAENSEMFTVSSDSVDTADLVNNIASPLLSTITSAGESSPVPPNPEAAAEPSAFDNISVSGTVERTAPTPLAEIPITVNLPATHHTHNLSHNNSSEQAAAAVTPSLAAARRSTSRRKSPPSTHGTKRRRRRRGGAIKQGNTASASSSTSSSVLSSPSSSSSLDAVAEASSSAATNGDGAGVMPTTPTTGVRAQLLLAAATVTTAPSSAAESALEHHHRMLLQPVVRVKKINMMPECSAASRRRSMRSEERLAAAVAAAAAVATTATTADDGDHHQPDINCSNGDVSLSTSASSSTASHLQSPAVAAAATSSAAAAAAAAVNKTQFSPPKLRKPRGRWYRER